MNETIENEEFHLTILFEEGDVVTSASDPLMCHTGSDQDFPLSPSDNDQGSTSAPDLLVLQEIADGNDVPEKLNIVNR